MKMLKDKLKGMKMPAKPMGEEEAGQDLELELAGEDEPMEAEMGEGEEGMEMEEGGPADMLADISDEDLLKEFKARGLSLDAEMPEGEEEEA